MKTLAVIKNELFKDYLKIVATDNLEQTLDNPEVPLPYTCLDSVNNDNSDLLAAQLMTYFQQSKVRNKDFYVLDEDASAQLSFMLNLIKLSSGQSSTISEVQSQPEKKTHNIAQPVVQNTSEVKPVIQEKTQETVKDSPQQTQHLSQHLVETMSPADVVQSPKIDIQVAENENNSSINNSTTGTSVESFVTEVKPEIKSENKVEPVKTFQKPGFSKPSIGKPSLKPGISQTLAEPEWDEENDPFAAELEQIHAQKSITSTLDDPNAFDPFKEIPADEMDDEDDNTEEHGQENLVPHQDMATTDEVNPFAPEEKVELSEAEEQVEEHTETSLQELGDIVPEFGIAKNSNLHFSKDESITATLVDDKHVNFEGQILSFTDAAKAAFKKAGSFGMATGLGNWLYDGQTLKALKEQKA